MVDNFCQSHFSADEKRNIFFHRNPRICNICNRPITKKTLNINNFSNNHRALVCGCHNAAHHAGGAGGHGAAYGAGGHGAGHGAGGHGAGGAGGHGAGGAGGHQIFVTVAQFNQFRNMIFQSLFQINGVVNNITNNVNNLINNMNNLTAIVNNLTANVNNLTANVNNLTADVNDLADNVNDLSEDVTDLTFTVNERFDELSQDIYNLN